MKTKLSRAQVREALDTIPDALLLGREASAELTVKQKRFAREVAAGNSKAESYRKAYKPTASKRTLSSEPYRVAADPRVAREIEALQLAQAAAEYRSPAALRALVIQTLAQTVIDPDVPPSVRVQAARVLGTVTEVAAFTERRETVTTVKSDTARAALLDQLRDMMRTVDASGQTDADALLAELATAETVVAEPHPAPMPARASSTHHGSQHTIPHNQSPIFSETPPLLEPETGEDPPSVLDEK